MKKGSHIFEIGDHGGLLLFSEDQEKTDSVNFTWDEGLNWGDFKVTQNKFDITNIITDPENNSQKFMVYGVREERSVLKNRRMVKTVTGVVVALDFTTLHQRICQGVDMPGTDDSDYELWSPGS